MFGDLAKTMWDVEFGYARDQQGLMSNNFPIGGNHQKQKGKSKRGSSYTP